MMRRHQCGLAVTSVAVLLVAVPVAVNGESKGFKLGPSTAGRIVMDLADLHLNIAATEISFELASTDHVIMEFGEPAKATDPTKVTKKGNAVTTLTETVGRVEVGSDQVKLTTVAGDVQSYKSPTKPRVKVGFSTTQRFTIALDDLSLDIAGTVKPFELPGTVHVVVEAVGTGNTDPTKVASGAKELATLTNVQQVDSIGDQVKITTSDGNAFSYTTSTKVNPATKSQPGPSPGGTPPATSATETRRASSLAPDVFLSGALERRIIERLLSEKARLTRNPNYNRALVKATLKEVAEELAAEDAKITVKQLTPSVRHDVDRIVEDAMQAAPPPQPETSTNRPSTRTAHSHGPAPVEENPHPRCECEFCHPLHPRGTCSLPYASPAVPWPIYYTPANYYGTPQYSYGTPQYSARRCSLHSGFCPFWWCKGYR